MLAVFKREFRSYFTSVTGYLFMAVMLFFVGLYFTGYNLSGSYYASFSYPLYSVNLIIMFAVPILTMRSLAEDRKSRTDQLLLTSPISVSRIVLGKYLALSLIHISEPTRRS